ncbi:hypothetical protein [Halorientalis halophila]|uniref:hypothetical protein n=1 Tax=Halorientalis halophila TaxID=3108499 RepID=UPI00300B93E9
MFEEGFINRLTSSFDRVLYGLDLLISLLIVVIIYPISRNQISSEEMLIFVRQGMPLATTLIIITITSVSILVSLSNTAAIRKLKEDLLYEKFLFTFEFTAILAILTSIVGIVLQTIGIGPARFYIFLFFFPIQYLQQLQ